MSFSESACDNHVLASRVGGGAPNRFFEMDALARGLAASSRILGDKNKVKGFEYGGGFRKLANQIVHAPSGQGKKFIDEAKLLNKIASKKKKSKK